MSKPLIFAINVLMAYLILFGVFIWAMVEFRTIYGYIYFVILELVCTWVLVLCLKEINRILIIKNQSDPLNQP